MRVVPAGRAAVRVGGHSMRERACFRPGERRRGRARLGRRGFRRCPAGHRGNQAPGCQAAALDPDLRSSRRNSSACPRGLPRPGTREEPVRSRRPEHDVPAAPGLADRDHTGHLVRPPGRRDLYAEWVRPVALAPDVAGLPLTPTRSRLRQLRQRADRAGQQRVQHRVRDLPGAERPEGHQDPERQHGVPGNTVPRKTSGTPSLDMPGSG
jgi:hypothetical protein